MAAPFIRDMRAGALLQSFFVSAIASLLLLRLILKLTHYPHLGGERLHIAHVLWGGILMAVAIVSLLSFVGRGVERFASVIGGIGFGAFIDEVGKFVTSDNDYFYRPAAAIIYVTFVLLYLSTRAIQTIRRNTPREYLINALVDMEEMALRDLDEEEAKRIQVYLDRSEQDHPLVGVLRSSFHDADLVPTRPPSRLHRAGRWIVERYRRLTGEPRFRSAVITIVVLDLLVKLAYVVFLVFFVQLRWERFFEVGFLSRAITRKSLSVVEWIQVGSWVLSAFFVARGVFLMRRSRMRALRMFEVSILTAILITHVFNFYRDQFLALVGFTFSVLMLVSVRFMIQQERMNALRASGG
jgi:hypothetical protein